MAIIDSQISLVNTEFSGDTESANKDTNNLFIDILKAVKGGQDHTGDLSEKSLIANPEQIFITKLYSQDKHDIAYAKAHVNNTVPKPSQRLNVS